MDWPVRTFDGQTELPLGPPQQRLVLARILPALNRTVSTDQLIATVWESEPPPSALNRGV